MKILLVFLLLFFPSFVYANNYILCDVYIQQVLPNTAPVEKSKIGFLLKEENILNSNNYLLRNIYDSKIEVREAKENDNSLLITNYNIDRFSGFLEGNIIFIPDKEKSMDVKYINKYSTYSNLKGYCKSSIKRQF